MHDEPCLVPQMQGIQGVKKIKDGYNPATWMLEVTTLAQEDALGLNFAEVYMNSDLYRYVAVSERCFCMFVYFSIISLIQMHHQEEQSFDK